MVMICDHSLDPRLERKLHWLRPHFDRCTVFQDLARGPITDKKLTDPTIEAQAYDSVGAYLNGLENQLIYAAGNKVLQDHFFSLWRASRRNTIIWEIADLPLRSRGLKNSLIALVFYFLLFLVNPHLVVTAPGFTRYLPRRRPFLLAENVPDEELARRLLDLPASSLPVDRPVRIGFPGAVRYFDQLKQLTDYARENPDEVEVHIWGGPPEAWERFEDHAGFSAEECEAIHYHGPYRMNDSGPAIYGATDVVWAVYENSQLNVRLALPNRLYEAFLAGRWILVARSTQLNEMVQEWKGGHALSFGEEADSSFGQQLQEALAEFRSRPFPEAARMEVLSRTERARSDFLSFVSRALGRSLADTTGSPSPETESRGTAPGP